MVCPIPWGEHNNNFCRMQESLSHLGDVWALSPSSLHLLQRLNTSDFQTQWEKAKVGRETRCNYLSERRWWAGALTADWQFADARAVLNYSSCNVTCGKWRHAASGQLFASNCSPDIIVRGQLFAGQLIATTIICADNYSHGQLRF